GHIVGDEILADVASILRQSVRDIDHVARYGGGEVFFVLVGTAFDAALGISGRIRRGGEGLRLCASNNLISVTPSLGVAHSRADDSGPEEVLARADHALYEAKRGGRNQAQCAM